MRITSKNISFVKEHTKNDETYEFFVLLKEGRDLDSRTYMVDDYRKLPVAVARFIDDHDPEIWSASEYKSDTYEVWIYR